MIVTKNNQMETFEHQTSVNQVVHKATSIRIRLKIPQNQPICVYDVCEKLNVEVRFIDNNMEGMYWADAEPRILLSSKRPLARRTFNCAHELGHHEFGDGSSIDELKKNMEYPSRRDPKESRADSFAAHLLMPIIGLRYALNSRNIKPQTATAEQLYVIACDFGVGYSTLITHLSAGLQMMSISRANKLMKSTPKTIRTKLLGQETNTPLIVADANRLNPRIDIETGNLLMLPKNAIVDAGKLKPMGTIKNASIFEASTTGIAQIKTSKWTAFARIARHEYVGRACYRHLEE